MSEAITRLTLFVPGVPASREAWGAALDGLDATVEWVKNDGEFGAAFSFGTVGPDVIAALEAAPGALVLRWPIDLHSGRVAIVAAVERLRDAGALAVRIEQSKLGWDVSTWLEHFSSDNEWSWHRAAVAFLTADGALQSCGMHAFSLPDVRVSIDDDPQDLQELASLLNVYQLAEDPVIRSGQTFTPNRDAPRRVVERWPDTQYASDHPCHNPYGVWRIGSPGGAARAMGDLVPVFMPTLRVLLEALEAKNGKPLSKKLVETTRDNSVCIAIEPRDAQKLERERGYTDLDPELAWEQWQIARTIGPLLTSRQP